MEDDERFKHLLTDPRFKNLRKKKAKVKIDDRFKSMFTDEKFTLKYSRDKRGRKDKKTSGDNLMKYYSLDERDLADDKSQNGGDDKLDHEKIDHDEKTASEDEDQLENDVNNEEGTDDEVEDEDEDEEEEEDESDIDEEGDESDSDVSSSSDEQPSDEEDELDQREVVYDWQPLDHDAVRTDQATRRIAIQNLDWDHFEVRDIYALIHSIRPPIGVKIYVSEFGKERLAKESVEGPQELIEAQIEEEEEKELRDLEAKMKALEEQNSLVKNYKNNEYEDADEVLDPKDEELREKIRQYQLSRMKYYYAIAEFDSIESAEIVYKELDGMEYEGSSLELDLRFVPDELKFDQADIKSECNGMSDLSSYKAPQFINTALQQTSVKFTWDETDIKRQEKLSRAYTKAELEKDDLEAYLGSDTDSEEDEELEDDDNGDAVSVVTGNSEARINKYKMLLESLDEEEKKKKKVDVDVVWGDFDGEEAADNKANHEDVDDTDEDECDEEEEEEKGEHEEKDDYHDDLDLLMMDSNARTNEEFRFDPDDARFKAIYESGLYNIDPSHPNFKRTEAINQIAEKKREKRQKTTNS